MEDFEGWRLYTTTRQARHPAGRRRGVVAGGPVAAEPRPMALSRNRRWWCRRSSTGGEILLVDK
jgi:hypothetical protein